MVYEPILMIFMLTLILILVWRKEIADSFTSLAKALGILLPMMYLVTVCAYIVHLFRTTNFLDKNEVSETFWSFSLCLTLSLCILTVLVWKADHFPHFKKALKICIGIGLVFLFSSFCFTI